MLMFLPSRYSEILTDLMRKIPAPRHGAPRWMLPLLGLTGIFAAVAWGFAEATLFFIVPDVLITLIALFSFKKSALAMLLATLGAVVGGALMFQWALASSYAA